MNKYKTSEEIFALHKGAFPLEECVRVIKEIRLNEIRSYTNYFLSDILNNFSDISEEQLNEIATAVKFFCRIEDAKAGYYSRNNPKDATEEYYNRKIERQIKLSKIKKTYEIIKDDSLSVDEALQKLNDIENPLSPTV